MGEGYMGERYMGEGYMRGGTPEKDYSHCTSEVALHISFITLAVNP